MPARAASPVLLPQTVKYARLASPTASAMSTSAATTSLPRLLISLDPAHPNAKAPTRGSAQAAGYDLYASEETVIPKSGRGMVPTGIRMAIPLGCYGRVAPRSGLGEYAKGSQEEHKVAKYVLTTTFPPVQHSSMVSILVQV